MKTMLLLAMPLVALLQASVIPMLYLDTAAAPALPVAAIAAWAAIAAQRAHHERSFRGWRPEPTLPPVTGVAAFLGAVTLGWLSTDTVGALLLALLPTLALLGLVRPRGETARGEALPATLGAVAAVGGGGGFLYHLTLLAFSGNASALIVPALPALVAAAMWTGAAASIATLMLTPLRRRGGGGLFA